jgi:acyl-CoA synthetase (NDP forming)
MRRRVTDLGHAGAMQGAHVQAMAGAGLDTLVGVTRDPSFGPLVAFGLGGTLVELMGDVVFRVAPLTDRDAREMVHAIRGARMFAGWRGAPPADVASIEDALARISQLVCDCPEIVEMDVNPLRVLEPGRGAVALDARIAVRGA